MLRVSAATAVTAVLALLILVLPRTLVVGLLSSLRPAQPPAHPAVTAQAILEAGYPASLFAAERARHAAPVYGIGTGPYRHDLGIAAGTGTGADAGDAAVLTDTGDNRLPTLVGRVRDAAGSRAVVETLLNPSWRTAVRVGTSSVDALLVGGLTPTLTTIPKGAPVAVGDVIVSTDPSLPYGLYVGTVAEVRDARDGVLREATVALPYALAGLRAVDVIDAGN